MAEDFRFTGFGKHDEFMAEIATDRTGIGTHRDRLEAAALEGAEIGDKHAVIGRLRRLVVEVEGIGVLHQEFAATHHAETRTALVAELPLDVVEIERQVLVGLDVGPEDVSDHFLIGRAEEHLAFHPVLDAQHLLAVVIIAAALAPEFGGLDGRHQDLDGPCPVLLLAHDIADLVERHLAERQPGIDAG